MHVRSFQRYLFQFARVRSRRGRPQRPCDTSPEDVPYEGSQLIGADAERAEDSLISAIGIAARKTHQRL